LLELADGEWAEVIGGKPLAGGEGAGDLGLIHGGRRGEAAKLDEEIEASQGRYQGGDSDPADRR
jgi:hypothetical protein